MSGNQESAATPRHGRFGAHTPEPLDCETPSTPRPRFKLKRRYDPQHLAAPTQQFLASVAAADTPMPSIEEPVIADFETGGIHSWTDPRHLEDDQVVDGLLIKFARGPISTPPKTPALGEPPSLTPSRYPNWSVDWMSSCESSPEPESRPSTARSSRTSRSSFSQLSSCFSDEEIQFSPDITTSEKFICFDLDNSRADRLHPQSAMSRIARKAPWTKAMSAHLWATYNMYLSDPRVTPFQIGKSGLPPEGVCKRVAREASRSWKGSKAVAKPTSASDTKSGSSTPTAESSGTFIQWPHTGAATRAHLRALCKQKARGPDGGKMRFSYFSRSPTPFTNTTARWVRRSTPGAAVSPFSTQEMSTSLAVTTSEAMHPDGPLAQLSNSALDSPDSSSPANVDHTPREPSPEERRRLGSPINAKSYGPSSSSSLLDIFGLAEGAGERQTRTVAGRRRLQSPVRLSRSSTQKRKTRQAHEARKRPSLSTDFWLHPASADRSERLFTHKNCFSMSHAEDDVFTSRAAPRLFPDIVQATSQQGAVPIAAPARLGSPFSASGSSFSVPNRFSQPNDFMASMFDRRFSTVHPSHGSQNESASSNLASRLAYIDQRLKELNSPSARTRSGSPL